MVRVVHLYSFVAWKQLRNTALASNGVGSYEKLILLEGVLFIVSSIGGIGYFFRGHRFGISKLF